MWNAFKECEAIILNYNLAASHFWTFYISCKLEPVLDAEDRSAAF
jgi:hypothetical protein